MKLLSFLSVFLLFICFNGVAQNAPAAGSTADPNSAKIQFVKDTIDYGTIEQGSEPFRKFEFKNTGKKDLVIASTQGSCGCTIPETPKEPIKPGKTGEIKVRYDTERVGQFIKNVTVTSNADRPSVVVYIKGVVTPKKDGAAQPKK